MTMVLNLFFSTFKFVNVGEEIAIGPDSWLLDRSKLLMEGLERRMGDIVPVMVLLAMLR